MTLVLSGATYRYPGSNRPALESVDLVLEPGEVVGVVGPNDAGKSTLALVASGLAPGVTGGVLDGAVQVDGLDTRTARPYELAQRCGILFQDSLTQLSGTTRSVWEEVAFGPRNLGLAVGEIVERVEDAIGLLGIEELAPRDPARLSGGQGQLVALASVLALRPRYLILDEPTSQLDPLGTRLVGDALASVARTGATGLLLIEHKTDLLERVCTRVVVLVGGRVAGSGAAREQLRDLRVLEAGIQPPARVSLQRAIVDAGLSVDGLALVDA